MRNALSPWLLGMTATGLLLVIGCGRGDLPELGTVRGQVTLDGKPTPNVQVEFSPMEGGRTSEAVSNAEGNYELVYSASAMGAKVGQHEVRIFFLGGDQDGVRIPPKYNTRTELTVDIQRGRNQHDFKLMSR